MHVSGEKGPAGMPEQEERLTADCSGDQLRSHLEPMRKKWVF